MEFAIALDEQDREYLEIRANSDEELNLVVNELMNSNRHEWHGVQTGTFVCRWSSFQLYLSRIKNVYVETA